MHQLEEHDITAHDPFTQDAMDEELKMRINEDGEYEMTQSLSTRRFVASHSHWKRKRRALHQMSQIKRTEVIDESNKKSIRKWCGELLPPLLHFLIIV